MSSLGDRMKKYESVPRHRLMTKTPVVARLDGKAFHTFTRGMKRPYDTRFHAVMHDTAIALCEEIQGCRVAYCQSDEITLLLTDYESFDTQAWFDYEVQKMCSVAASIATAVFNRNYAIVFGRPLKPAHFDARFWNVSKEEVNNVFIWRQQDATRNSILSLAQSHFSPKQMHGKDQSALHDMLHGVGVNWNDCPVQQKRGACVIREKYEGPEGSIRHRWVVDTQIPIFTADRNYIERFVYPEQSDEVDRLERHMVTA